MNEFLTSLISGVESEIKTTEETLQNIYDNIDIHEKNISERSEAVQFYNELKDLGLDHKAKLEEILSRYTLPATVELPEVPPSVAE